MKDCKEWSVQCPWGKLALVSWGNPKNPPILLVHGYLDSAATFLPMLECMPDKYFYVGLDFPGHGKSEHFPAGLSPLQSHMVESIRIAVNYLNWDRFIFLGHSMAILIGLYYNAVYPGEIISFIALDPGQPLGAQTVTAHELSLSYTWTADYYDHYDKYNSASKIVKYEDTLNSVVQKRGFSIEQASLVMSRSLQAVADGDGSSTYKLTIDNKMKKLAHDQLPIETIVHLMTNNYPTILTLVAKDNKSDWNLMGLEVLDEVRLKNKNCHVVFLNGAHDFHVVNSNEVACCLVEFLERDFNSAVVKCKI